MKMTYGNVNEQLRKDANIATEQELTEKRGIERHVKEEKVALVAQDEVINRNDKQHVHEPKTDGLEEKESELAGKSMIESGTAVTFSNGTKKSIVPQNTVKNTTTKTRANVTAIIKSNEEYSEKGSNYSTDNDREKICIEGKGQNESESNKNIPEKSSANENVKTKNSKEKNLVETINEGKNEIRSDLCSDDEENKVNRIIEDEEKVPILKEMYGAESKMPWVKTNMKV